jgi:exosortase C (VPDSG-CTERM-specific)
VAERSRFSQNGSRRLRWFAGCSAALALGFALPLLALARVALASELYSYVLLIPFVSGYLVWQQREQLAIDVKPVSRLAWLPLLAGMALLAGYHWARSAGWNPAPEARLTPLVLAWLALLLGAAFLCLGAQAVRRIAFSLALLLFMVPLPDWLLQPIVAFLQHRSADVASAMFALSGTPLLRDDTHFLLPGMPLTVAPECSGIHSSMVLLITSLVAGHCFLRARWRRAVLALAVIPLALVRNAFRIFTIGQLCIHFGPQMLHSPIHKQGGPFFFVLSLIPFLLLLLWLHKQENRTQRYLI